MSEPMANEPRINSSGVPLIHDEVVDDRDAPDGEVWVRRELHSYSSDIDAFCDHVRYLATGLTRAFVSIGVDDYGEDGTLWVLGLRTITDTDRRVIDAQRERAECRERAEFARLKAKYDPSLIASTQGPES